MVDDGDENVFQKQIWKTITQPTRLTECVMQATCKEVTDKSGRGLYRFRICKIPTRKYDVTSYQPVYSIEEVVDEIANVCFNLKESGQLIESNRTKDSWDHKLMRVDFADKFSFGISVGFVPLRDEVDPASIKRLEIQRNEYLQKVILDMSDELTTIKERNKYVVLADPEKTLALNMPGKGSDLELRASQYTEQTTRTTDEAKDQQSQLTQYGEVLDSMQEFVKQNSDYRGVVNDYTHSLNQKWQATFEEFKNDSGN
ncbi:MAG: hypothetical protein H6765_03975 [Candidatus Peribacteria bacterium]|nr:MAG: hypothetical protein H6765_03975 [Candidatus Peribacteria bacterium]